MYTSGGLSVRDYWCRQSCGVCTAPPLSSPPPPPPRPPPSPCVDQLSYCADWKNSGYCDPTYTSGGLSVRDYWCRLTCGVCTAPPLSSPPPPPPRPPPSPCVDQLSYCADWKNNGYCDPMYTSGGLSVRDYWCRQSCGVCTAPPNAPFPPPLPGDALIGGCADPAASLLLHNQYRTRHGSPALGWNNTLAQQAKNWAANLALNNSCGLYHEGVAGENLYMASTSSQTSPLNCSRAVDAWYGEISLYKFTSTPYTDNTFSSIGHFTQVVWASTAQVGCGAVRGTNCYVVSCRYAPPGNIIGDSNFLANVLPPVSARRSLEVDVASVDDVLPTGSDSDGQVVITSVA
ncbi:hypothetical protein VOLCADRAFT_75954 [Volvox carteri f. nagariensis]|uniref:ShKT domain-containing protein n=1 Tax=Volvox carteri f. nagariensis TaxID=3068 RepID=D8U4Z9_VOLCA|nr:uncharacterized protein VOLCADRAFT_75954 [Volvox carteri f. nagariensis]EFJ45359.1 hypothetical protein VOLCADRAFT_75954 [Volvox carteri f. nagariensis]|eukprot:XP_002953735.1 hypothetical protein VOLCADRAFT_75954 [Volvox carteri f. nagariensis]